MLLISDDYFTVQVDIVAREEEIKKKKIKM